MISISPILAVLIWLLLFVSVGAAPAGSEDKKCGAAVDGLEMCLTSSGSNLELALRNVGDQDLTLNLGIALGNGKVQIPNRVAINFTDAQGKTRTFKFTDLKHGFVAGRVDDYVVPLRVGSTYTLQLGLDQFACHETKEFSIALLPGDNYLTAHLEGTGAAEVNLDMSGFKLMNFWLGKVDSNTVTLRR